MTDLKEFFWVKEGSAKGVITAINMAGTKRVIVIGQDSGKVQRLADVDAERARPTRIRRKSPLFFATDLSQDLQTC